MSDLFIEVTEEIEVDNPYPIPEQHGPLRWYDVEKRCASRGCSGPCYSRVQGVPYCMKHALDKLNEMLIKLGVME
jgi:hypothetical protein